MRVGSVLSRVHVQENSVPQDGVSRFPFIVQMNSLGKALPSSIAYLTYVDGFQMPFKSWNLPISECQVELVSKLAGSAIENGFKLSPEKVLLFSRRHGIRLDLEITLNGFSIPVKKEQIFNHSTRQKTHSFHT